MVSAPWQPRASTSKNGYRFSCERFVLAHDSINGQSKGDQAVSQIDRHSPVATGRDDHDLPSVHPIGQSGTA